MKRQILTCLFLGISVFGQVVTYPVFGESWYVANEHFTINSNPHAQLMVQPIPRAFYQNIFQNSGSFWFQKEFGNSQDYPLSQNTLYSFQIGQSKWTIDPVARLARYTSGGSEYPEDIRLNTGNLGFEINGYLPQGMGVYLSYFNGREWRKFDKENMRRLNDEKGVAWHLKSTPGVDSFDFDHSEMALTYGTSDLFVEIGKRSHRWGHGIRGTLLISDKSPAYPSFRMVFSSFGNFQFTYLHGWLNSTIKDTTMAKYYGEGVGSERKFMIPKQIAAHRIDWRPFSNLTIGASESVVYAVRQFEAIYWFPVIPFLSAQQYLGDLDNVQMDVDFAYYPIKNLKLYGEFYVDEWKHSNTFDKINNNWFAYQTGLMITEGFGFIPKSTFHLEYTKLDPRVYVHKYKFNTFEHFGYPLGFWTGNNADDLFLCFKKYFKQRIEFRMFYANTRKGMTRYPDEVGFDDDSLNIQYSELEKQYGGKYVPFLEHKTDERRQVGFGLTLPIWRDFIVDFQAEKIIWEHRNYLGANEWSDFETDEKWDFFIDFSYRFPY